MPTAPKVPSAKRNDLAVHQFHIPNCTSTIRCLWHHGFYACCKCRRPNWTFAARTTSGRMWISLAMSEPPTILRTPAKKWIERMPIAVQSIKSVSVSLLETLNLFRQTANKHKTFASQWNVFLPIENDRQFFFSIYLSPSLRQWILCAVSYFSVAHSWIHLGFSVPQFFPIVVYHKCRFSFDTCGKKISRIVSNVDGTLVQAHHATTSSNFIIYAKRI